MATRAVPATDDRKDADADKRDRILRAAMECFREHGFAAATTLEIATRARVSKRELYALVGSKQAMLVACITERARRLEVPADMPAPRDRETLARVLASFGKQLLSEVSDPTVIAVFRLAIGEALIAPEVAHALESLARQPTRVALRQLMARAQKAGLLDHRPTRLAEQFLGLLWCDWMVDLLLGVAERPSPREIAARARGAAAAFVELYATPLLRIV
jgi:AcrR family transcriptional regulator